MTVSIGDVLLVDQYGSGGKVNRQMNLGRTVLFLHGEKVFYLRADRVFSGLQVCCLRRMDSWIATRNPKKSRLLPLELRSLQEKHLPFYQSILRTLDLLRSE